MELNDVLRVLRQEWMTAAAMFVAVLAATVALVVTPAPSYTSTVTLLVEPSDTSNGGGNIAIVQFLMPALQARVESLTMATSVTDAAPELTAAAVSATPDPGTGLLSIVTRGPADVVQPAAQAYAKALIRSQEAADRSPVSIGVLDPASPAAESSTRSLVTILAGLVLAAMLALSAALLVHRLRRRGGLATEVTSKLGLPVLGEIPRFRSSDRTLLQPGALYEGSDVVAIEAFMRLRTSLEIQMQARSLNSLSVVSRDVSEGKSTVAMHIAWTLASVGHRVCLVEADLRRPSLLRYLGVGQVHALSTDPGRRMLGTALPKLRLAPARLLRQMAGDYTTGQTFDLHPSDVTGRVLPAMIEESTLARELIVLDLPPLAGAAEARLAVSMTDAAVVVADVRRKDLLESLDESVQQVQEAGGTVLGIVLNRAKVPRRRRRQIDAYHVRVRQQSPSRQLATHVDAGVEDRLEAYHVSNTDFLGRWAPAEPVSSPLPVPDPATRGAGRASRASGDGA